MVLIIVNVLINDEYIITFNRYKKTIIPGVSTIEDVAILDPDVYDKIDYWGNITLTEHLTEDTGEQVTIFYDKELNVKDIDIVVFIPPELQEYSDSYREELEYKYDWYDINWR